ncbi:hypothetical protein [Streptomyces sp. CC228A]|uniref:hypothetical protein n=1 Tax=Streptomyces sp. CC228A TaxID=2898186 RepID=UPI001F25E589|nr:hypothetical protein [Streptomyces sp. CC228A]
MHVPRRCVGVVVQALLREEATRGAAVLARRLGRLVDAAWAGTGPRPASGPAGDDPGWWAARLLQGTLLRVRDARPYGGVLRQLAGRIATHPPGRPGGPDGVGGTRDFGPWFWERLRLGEDERLELFRRLLPADGPAALHGAARPRYLEAVALRLAADPRGVQPLLCRWFTDERTLRAEPGTTAPPTVAGVAQALLYTHRDLAVDDLCEALVATAHPRATELLTRLTRDEPSALCRAVDRWAHDDDRPARRAAAAAYGRLLAEHAADGADREPLRYAARALLARPGDRALHGAALAVLVRDPHARARHLPRALAAFRDGAPGMTAAAVATALTTHPEAVLAAFAARLRDDRGAADALDALAAVRVPALARRAAALVRGYADRHPEGAGHVAAYTARRLEQGRAARATLLPLVAELARYGSRAVREALAGVLTAQAADPDGLRAELLAVLLDAPHPDDGGVDAAEAVLRAAALGAAGRPEQRTRELVLRSGRLMRRVPAGAARFDRRLAGLARDVPGFAVLLSGWMAREPRRWEALVSAGARRAVERLAAPGPDPAPVADPAGGPGPVPVPALSAMPMRAGRRGHGTLRPA